MSILMGLLFSKEHLFQHIICLLIITNISSNIIVCLISKACQQKIYFITTILSVPHSQGISFHGNKRRQCDVINVTL